MGDIKFYSPVDFDDTSSGVTIEGELNAKGDVKITGAIYDSNNSPGTSGQVLSSTASGTDWVNQGNVVAGSADKALSVTLIVKNTEAIALTKGQVVCAAPSATPPSGNVIEVKLADNNGTDSMPAIGVLNEGLDAAGGANDEGEAIMFGKVSGIDTSAFDVGDEVFVSDTAGGLTKTKPTGVKYIQKIGVVIRDDASNGTIEVFGAGRTNDVPTPLYIDHANQRLGIGTTSPGAKLEVAKGSEGLYLKVGGDNASNGRGLTFTSGSNNGSVGALHTINATSGNGAISLNTAGVSRLFLDRLGNVGVGTTAPDSNLSISTGNVNSRLDFSDERGYVGYNTTYGSSGGIYIDGGGTNNKALILNPVSTGNVGIGTTNPNSKLQVNVGTNQNVGINSHNSVARISSYNDAFNASMPLKINGSDLRFDINSSEKMRIDTSGNVGIGTTNPGTKLEVSAATSAITIRTSYPTDSSQRGALLWKDSTNITGAIDTRYDGSTVDMHFGSLYNSGYNSTTRLTIKGNGNVGIGTTSPASRFHIYQPSGATGFRLTRSNNITGVGLNITVDSSKNIISGYGGLTFRTATTGNGTNASERMRIDTSGNVGIGTTNPSQKLQIFESGNSAYKSYTSTNAGAILTSYQSQGNPYTKTTDLVAASDGTVPSEIRLLTRTNGSSTVDERMRIDSSGNVGIGTDSPASKLHLSDTAVILTTTSTNGVSGFIHNVIGGATALYRLQNNGSERIRITSAGNVGIGTTNPSQKLDVAGNISLRHTTEDAIKFGGAGDLYGTSSANSVKLQKPGRSQYFLFGTQTGYFQVSDGTNNILLRAESTPEVNIYNTGALNYTQHSATNNNNGNVLTWSNSTSGNGERGRVSIVGDLRLDDYSSGSAVNVVNIENNGDAYFLGNIGIGPNNAEIRTNGDDLELKTDTGNNYVNILTNAGNNLVAKIGIGTWMKYGLYAGMSSIPSAVTQNTHRVIIQGSGTTSSTTALLVENSSGSDLFKIRDDGNVGIGTTNPSEKLHVVGNAILTTSDSRLRGGDTAGRLVVSNSNTTSYITLNGSTRAAGANEIAFVANSTASMLINSSGNVGINTTAPENKLHVQQSDVFTGIHSTAGIRIKSNGASAINNYHGTIALSRGTGSVAISAVQEDADSDVMGMAFFTHPSTTGGDAAVEKVRIDHDGNVGIGTTSIANAKLKVAGGGVDIESATDSLRLRFYEGATFKSGIQQVLNIGEMITASAVGDMAIRASAGNMLFATGGSTEKMRIDTSGNVGIGTTSPNRLFQVEGGIASFQSSGDSAAILLYPTTTKNLIYSRAGNTSGTAKPLGFVMGNSEAVTIDNSGNVGIGTTNPGYPFSLESATTGLISRIYNTNTDGQGLLIRAGATTSDTRVFQAASSNDTKIMTVNSNGNVGIGTTNPTETLDIRGSVKIGKDGTSPYLTFDEVPDSSSGSEFYLTHDITGNILKFTDDNSNDFIAMDRDNGNVGIGTTSPDYKLDVEGSVNDDVTARIYNSFDDNNASSTPKARLWLEAASNNGYLRVHGAPADTVSKHQIDLGSSAGGSFLTFTLGVTERMRITNSGNIGIGITNPSEKLSIATSTNTSAEIGYAHVGYMGHNTYAGFSHVNQNTTLSYAFLQGSDGETFINAPTSKNVNFRINNATHMILNSSGNIGIGTTSPSQKLDVVGSAKVSGQTHTGTLRVDATAAAPTPVINQTPLDAIVRPGGDTYIYLSDPDEWLEININGTNYVIPAYEA